MLLLWTYLYCSYIFGPLLVWHSVGNWKRAELSKKRQYYMIIYIYCFTQRYTPFFVWKIQCCWNIEINCRSFFWGFLSAFLLFFFSRFLINWQWPMQMLLAFWLGHRYIYTEPKIQIQLPCQRSKTAPAAYGIQFKNVSKRYITHYGHGLPSLDLEIPFTAFFPTPKARQKSRDTFVRMYICMYVCLYVRYMYVCIYGEVAFWGLYIYRYFSGLWSLLVLVSWLQGLHDTQFPPTSVFSGWDWVVAVFIRIVVNFIRV